MKINYNDWFYEYHKYLKGIRKGKEGYNDTKWKNMNQRLKTLIDLDSDIIHEQPFGVISNYNGFDKLIDLMDKSDYTFQDLNESLIDTYKMSFENAMSRMVVNTHAVISHCNSNDKKHTNYDPKDGKYYIVDVPFNQMHFGDRDEMIRQYLSEVYCKQTNHYIPMDRFNSTDIQKVLGFTFLCTTNGMICNDWGVAVDDKGFHFRILWGRGYDVDFIIYKLDRCIVSRIDNVPINSIRTGFIETYYPVMDGGLNCIIDIFDQSTQTSSTVVPNFGVTTESGIRINNVQQKTLDDLELHGVSTCSVIVYGIKYLFELPNVYPCINFLDMLYQHPIITENDDDVVTNTGYDVIGMSYDENTNIPACTPPISIDRSASTSFNIILDCIKLKEDMMNLDGLFHTIGNAIKISGNNYYIRKDVLEPSTRLLNKLKELYKVYLSGGIITSLINHTNKWKFENLVNRLSLFVDKVNENPTFETTNAYSLQEFYGIYYSELVQSINSVYDIPALQVFRDLDREEFTKKYLNDYDKNTRITRPISEQCFISLRYSHEENAWVFTYPNIKHFHGIGNTFYINDGMREDDVYKFFFLYTDTEDPLNTNIDEFEFDDVFDFDKFSTEVDSYQAYIRYWNVENHIRKISRIMFSDDSTDKQVNVLSKILNKKLDGEEILDLYPSDMNYEESNVTSDYINDYTETSIRSPFAVNFLFYTISMMYDNKDQLLSYFINRLTGKDFSNRYVDINISDLLDINADSIPVNYSKFTIDQNETLNSYNTKNLPDESRMLMYGVPNVFAQNGTSAIASDRYNVTFTRFNDNVRFPYITDNCDLNNSYYIGDATNAISKDYTDTTNFIKTIFACIEYCDDVLNVVETNYSKSFDIGKELSVYIDKIQMYIDELNSLIDTQNVFIDNTSELIDDIDNIKKALDGLYDAITKFRNSVYGEGVNKNIYYYTNSFVKKLRQIFVSFGFDDFANERISALYYHLIKINSPMTLYEFKHWINDIDYDCLKNISDVMANNPNNPTIKPIEYFNIAYDTFSAFKDTSVDYIEMIFILYNDIRTTIRDKVFGIVSSVYQDLKDNLMHDMYSISEVTIGTSPTFQQKPRYIIINANIIDSDMDENAYNFIFIPFCEKVSNNEYKIREIIPICDYAIFGDSFEINSLNVYNNTGSTIQQPTSLLVDVSLVRVGNTFDKMNDMSSVPNILHTEYTFQHIHEYEQTVGNMVSVIKNANMNYELLAGNKFIPLTYEQELVLDRTTLLPGPIDNVNIPNMEINRLAKQEIGNHESTKMYFKPVQVVHNEIDQSLTSTGGRYHIGQTLYVKTNDENQFVFPIIVTEIDHNISHGFIEAMVDYNNSKWFNIKDDTLINEYLTNPIECEVLDDNICNFMDEFSNENYINYPIPKIETDTNETIYTLPGDPLYVTTNGDYVYTRLSWMFDELVPNRFIDDTHKRYRFVYISSGSIIEDGSLTLFMLNHNFNTLTLPEMYPILRQEPNDHSVYIKEKQTFTSLLNIQMNKLKTEEAEYEEALEEYYSKETKYEKLIAKLKVEECELKINRTKSFIERLEDYINQPESKTTWYNLYAYDDAITYINNGRAKMSRLPRFNIRDIVYTDKIEIRMYDWENKVWLNPNDFTIDIETTTTNLDAKDEYDTTDVQYAIHITPTDPTYHSKKILVYFVYNKSDIYEDIDDNPKLCNVIFKPFISMYESDDNSMYKDIRIRKHFDSSELYRIDENYINDDFSLETGYHVKRIRRSGKYTDSSILRWNDMNVTSGNSTYTFDDFDIYERFPFPNINSDHSILNTSYTTFVRNTIDDFTDNEIVTLICVQSDYFNINTSMLLFTGRTIIDGVRQRINIIDCSNHFDLPNGKYICTIAKDPKYKSVGGMIEVTVNNTYTTQIMDENHKWYKVTNPQYKIIPNEFIIVPKEFTMDFPVYIELKNEYLLDTANQNPYTYYYDTNYQVRYPISDIRHNQLEDRLSIDLTENQNVRQIKSNYVGVCRYSCQIIPDNGLLDFTGYIQTPLSRKRYEFWVNGRCVTNSDNMVILSPTSIQLVNLKSLRNFELIELVDNVDSSDTVFPTGAVYMDLEGNTFSSYLLMMNSNRNIRYQNIKYRFYFNTKKDLDVYTRGMIPNPNNKNVETDILDYLVFTDDITSYNQLHNIPTINGVPIYHPTTNDLGLIEIPAEKISETYDRVWRYEICMNPLFPMTHRDIISDRQYINLHVFVEDDHIRISSTGLYNGFFTLFISTTNPGSIENWSTTKKIIPMVMLGTNIIIDKEYEGMWLYCTYPNTPPKEII